MIAVAVVEVLFPLMDDFGRVCFCEVWARIERDFDLFVAVVIVAVAV